MQSLKLIACCGAMALILAACGGGATDADKPAAEPAAQAPAASDPAAFAQQLQQKLNDAKPGDVIEIPAGTWKLRRGLVLRADGVTIRGAGMHKSILSFKGMVSGPQGLLVNGNNFTIEDLSIEDTLGDGLKIKQGNNIVIRRVRTVWTNGPDSDNGAYGIYPIRTTNLLLEECIAEGASDSGIYVGQSRNVIVRNNTVRGNVAGIEIENTIGADVYGNQASGNTGGILVFNMPNLMQVGDRVRVFDNKVTANNHANFGAPGTPVASVPAGSGIVINSNDNVEIFNNEIADNKTANIIVSSYYSTNYSTEAGVNPDYNPYPTGIFIHDNRFSGGGEAPGTEQFMQLKNAVFGADGRFPDVVWDGFHDPQAGADGGPVPATGTLCVPNEKVRVFDADAGNGFKQPNMDDARFRCTLPALPPIKLEQASAAP